MPSDQVVHSKDVLKAVFELRRLGHHRVLNELEAREPDLTEYALEELTTLHHKFTATGLPPRTVRRLRRRVEAMVLVLITALRAARLRLWQDEAQETVSPAPSPKQAEAHESSLSAGSNESAIADNSQMEGSTDER